MSAGQGCGPVRDLYYRRRPPRCDPPGMARHAEYCPIAVGVEVVGDRWTPLVLRELSIGASGFNEIHRGLPRLSRTLLAQRLRTLERRGLVHRAAAVPGRQVRYSLTPAGTALASVVWALGQWAARRPERRRLRWPGPDVAHAPVRRR
ncbi:hypothetical protein FMEAI12_2590007 [Parafrankia sp. Ea1.12]|nr:hypothetical protein FMEAI12_2590007 [Parafrankia sp. Ea1.12]